jgi:hypothetical protein
MIGPGKNIAIKEPLHKWHETVAFYRDRVGLRSIRQSADTVAFELGAMTLWIDGVEKQSQIDVWLELFTDEPDQALLQLGSPVRDELEPLDGVDGHWTSDPAGVVVLVRNE